MELSQKSRNLMAKVLTNDFEFCYRDSSLTCLHFILSSFIEISNPSAKSPKSYQTRRDNFDKWSWISSSFLKSFEQSKHGFSYITLFLLPDYYICLVSYLGLLELEPNEQGEKIVRQCRICSCFMQWKRQKSARGGQSVAEKSPIWWFASELS